jgi:hypothetical protein
VTLDRTTGAPVPAFPSGAWSPRHVAIAVLSEFVQTDWTAITLAGPHDDPSTNQHALTGKTLAHEVNELIGLIEYRGGMLSEALMQRDNMLDYWRGLLSFSRESHPATFAIVRAAVHIGQFMAVHFKWQFQFPRPSQLAPALMPPIDPPGHASYPSGHATEAYLLSGALRHVLPNVTSNGLHDALEKLAERVARNREVLGLHYPRDSAAGKDLANNVLPLFRRCPTIQKFEMLAQGEWSL